MVDRILDKIYALLSTTGGWFLTLVLAFMNYLGDLKLALGAVLLAIFVDMGWGIWAAIKRHEFILSHLFRETFLKIAIYGSSLLLIMVIERSMHDSWFVATKTACAIAAACELWSIFANILIVRPKTPFIKLFRKYLAGEISRKLHIDDLDCLKKNGENKDKKEE